MTIPVPALVIALSLVILAATASAFMASRRRRRLSAPVAPDPDAVPIETRISGLALRIELLGDQLASQEQLRRDEATALQDNLTALRCDVEWLTSERMIEQAIAMCREGAPNHEISDKLGLGPDAIRTIRLLRAH